MDLDVIRKLVDAELLTQVDEIDPRSASIRPDGRLLVSGRCPIKIERSSASLNRVEDVVINDCDAQAFATICFTKGSQVSHHSDLTSWRYVAYLAEAVEEDVKNGEGFVFKYDYVVVDEDRLDEYLGNYVDGAPIWGGFSHGSVPLSMWSQDVGSIQAVPGIKVPTHHHKEAFHRYLSANNSFERFLRLYHCVELLFDYVTYRKIQALNDDLVGYAAVMKDNGRTEFDRLLSIIMEYCLSHDILFSNIKNADSYKDVCLSIFQDYTKDSNPLSSAEKFEKFWTLLEGEAMSAANVKAEKICNDSDVRKLLCKTAAYWIYRIRCSIAHNRVGEFILADQHEVFVAEFGVPLLQSVVVQILSEPSFKALIPNQS